MKLSTRVFEDKPAVREMVPMFVALAGGPSVGKTLSALRLAVGAQRIYGGEIFFIDTEGKRALAYSEGHGDSRFKFKFRHVDFQAPYRSLDYLAAIQQCYKNGARVMIVDSMTHEHENTGGYLDYQEAELYRLSKGKEDKRDNYNRGSWKNPKFERRAMINGILNLGGVFMIFCFRAEEKTDWDAKDQNGKKKVEKIGFVPVGCKTFLYEQQLSCLLQPQSDGVPTWITENSGEKEWIKLPEQFRRIFHERKQLSEDIGQQLAEWAKGGVPASPRVQQPQATNGQPIWPPKLIAMCQKRNMTTEQMSAMARACDFNAVDEITRPIFELLADQISMWDADSADTVLAWLPKRIAELRAGG